MHICWERWHILCFIDLLCLSSRVFLDWQIMYSLFVPEKKLFTGLLGHQKKKNEKKEIPPVEAVSLVQQRILVLIGKKPTWVWLSDLERKSPVFWSSLTVLYFLLFMNPTVISKILKNNFLKKNQLQFFLEWSSWQLACTSKENNVRWFLKYFPCHILSKNSPTTPLKLEEELEKSIWTKPNSFPL